MLRERQHVITMQGTCSHMTLLMFRYKQNHFRAGCWYKPLLTQAATLYEAVSQVGWMERPKNRHKTKKSKAAKRCQLLSDEYSMTVLVASGPFRDINCLWEETNLFTPQAMNHLFLTTLFVLHSVEGNALCKQVSFTLAIYLIDQQKYIKHKNNSSIRGLPSRVLSGFG